ncbi:MAG: hypothetical protein IPI67_13130 [Myxococcales bacterium]|nr:hypothetical protein [Myxococcales bacterium]
MQPSRWTTFGATWALVLVACSSEDSLGQKRDAESGGVPPSKAELFSKVPACAIPDPTTSGVGGGGPKTTVDPSLVGTWVGYIENYQKTTSDQLELVISEGSPSGFLVFGSGPPPPPPASGSNAYPEDFPISSYAPPLEPYEGFEYALLKGEVDGTRVRFSLASRQLWRDWCPLQTSYASAGGCSCLPSWGGQFSQSGCVLENPETQELVKVFCAQVGLCRAGYSACKCTTSGCRSDEAPDVDFDLDHQGGQLDGSMTSGWWGDYTVRFNRVLEAGPPP